MDAASLALVLSAVALLLSLYVYRRQASGDERGRATLERIAKEVADARAESARREAAKTAAESAKARSDAMFREYVITYAETPGGIPPAILAKNEPLPADWVADWERRHPVPHDEQ